MAKFVNWFACIPHIGLPGVVALGAQAHVRGRELQSILSRVLSNCQTTSWCTLSSENVQNRKTPGLPRVATPNQRVDILVVLER